MKGKQQVMRALDDLLAPRGTYHFLSDLVAGGEIFTALDIGCGISSALTKFRPNVTTVGLDVFTADFAEKSESHDFYINSDILTCPLDVLHEELEKMIGRPKVDLITLFGVIEHFNKSDGWRVLEKIESLTEKFLFLETPNGFVPQGPEFGNPYQRHLSGWFPNDFRGLGYTVFGGKGTRYLRGYMGEPRLPLPGLRFIDNVLVSRLVLAKWLPQHAFHLCAVKDIRGVPARYESYDDPDRR